ncbi:unnamed protein product [Linum tenue]|uniref:Uncharacterized protein n=1 Tax=Linum tenue TaxID=586396 RepID=A0AAV0HC10_9ROSI|nr:unnamed protein product [Linum tenue]
MWTGLVPCAILLFGLLLILESPRWLAKTCHEKEFEVALQEFCGNDADILEEAAEMKVILMGRLKKRLCTTEAPFSQSSALTLDSGTPATPFNGTP